jgi:hypothetical protein
MQGKCCILPLATKKIKSMYKAGRGKNFDFKTISNDTVMVFKKGEHFVLTEKEFKNNFRIKNIHQDILGGDTNGTKYDNKCYSKTKERGHRK